MDIIVSNRDERPIYEQIAAQIKSAILTGELGPDDALPSMRLLAKELRVSVITTKRAYEELERDGFIVSVVGKGSFVAQGNLDFIREERRRKLEEALAIAVREAKTSGVDRRELLEIVTMLYEEE